MTSCVCAEDPPITVGDPRQAYIGVDGSNVSLHLYGRLYAHLGAAGVPMVHIEQAVAAVQRWIADDPEAIMKQIREEDQERSR